jgi:hypothetical protein
MHAYGGRMKGKSRTMLMNKYFTIYIANGVEWHPF